MLGFHGEQGLESLHAFVITINGRGAQIGNEAAEVSEKSAG